MVGQSFYNIFVINDSKIAYFKIFLKLIPYLFNDNTYVCIIIYNVNGLAFKGKSLISKQANRWTNLVHCVDVHLFENLTIKLRYSTFILDEIISNNNQQIIYHFCRFKLLVEEFKHC